jgi:hypothetical protein
VEIDLVTFPYSKFRRIDFHIPPFGAAGAVAGCLAAALGICHLINATLHSVVQNSAQEY